MTWDDLLLLGKRFGGSVSAKAFSCPLVGGSEILLPDTNSIVGARQLKTFDSKLPMEKPASPPEYKSRSRRKSEDPGMKNDSCDKTLRSRISPSCCRSGGTNSTGCAIDVWEELEFFLFV